MQFLKLKNWERYQHYKDRNPPWIKLYQDLISSLMWVTCDDASRALAVACMVLAAKTGNRIPLDPLYLRRVAYLNSEPDFKSLLSADFVEIIDESGTASNVLAERYQVAIPETETETEKRQRKKQKGVATLPDWVSKEPWDAWLEVRSKIRAPNTPRALNLALRELERLKGQGHDPGAVLEQSTMRGWRGLFPISKVNGAEPDYSQVIARIKE